MADATLGEKWTNATVYRRDWFGTTDNSEEDDCRIRGRFRNVSLIYDANKTAFPDSNHNPYDIVHDNYAMSKSKYLQVKFSF